MAKVKLKVQANLCEVGNGWIALFRRLRWRIKEDSSHMATFIGEGKFRGWTAHISAGYPGQIMVWAGDTLAIKIPEAPSAEALLEATSQCFYCGAKGVEVTQLGFAGRACLPCREKLAPSI